jgi:hypothetical protein
MIHSGLRKRENQKDQHHLVTCSYISLRQHTANKKSSTASIFPVDDDPGPIKVPVFDEVDLERSSFWVSRKNFTSNSSKDSNCLM